MAPRAAVTGRGGGVPCHGCPFRLQVADAQVASILKKASAAAAREEEGGAGGRGRSQGADATADAADADGEPAPRPRSSVWRGTKAERKRARLRAALGVDPAPAPMEDIAEGEEGDEMGSRPGTASSARGAPGARRGAALLSAAHSAGVRVEDMTPAEARAAGRMMGAGERRGAALLHAAEGAGLEPRGVSAAEVAATQRALAEAGPQMPWSVLGGPAGGAEAAGGSPEELARKAAGRNAVVPVTAAELQAQRPPGVKEAFAGEMEPASELGTPAAETAARGAHGAGAVPPLPGHGEGTIPPPPAGSPKSARKLLQRKRSRPKRNAGPLTPPPPAVTTPDVRKPPSSEANAAKQPAAEVPEGAAAGMEIDPEHFDDQNLFF